MSIAGRLARCLATAASTTRPARSTRSTRCASTGSSRARSWPAGACCAATRGATAASITRKIKGSSRDSLQPADTARAPAPSRARLAARDDRAALGLVDRGADDHRPGRARAADGAPDPFDAGDAGTHAGDEGDPAEVQGRQEAPAGRVDEVLPREQDQPGRVLPAAPGAAADLLRPVFRAPALLEAPAVRVAVVVAHRPEHRCARERSLVRLSASRHLRRESGLVDLLHVGDDGQDAALPNDGAADLLHHVPAPVPDGARRLLGDDEPLDRGAGARDASLDAEDAALGAAAPLLSDATEGGAFLEGWDGQGCAGTCSRTRSLTAAEGETEEAGTAMSDQLQIEATGETVGEAKWSALRELEKLQPGLDKAAVKFQVISEGERGLLGVGFAPARVIAIVEADGSPADVAEAVDESELAATVRELLERIVREIGIHARLAIEEDDETLTAGFSGRDLGLLIGKHGQTIHAIQYLANAIVYRGQIEDRKAIVVDAAGYRERRKATLDALAVRSAERAVSTGQRVELEPMTAVERKVVHLRLKDYPGVVTASEGTEPNRFVVIAPGG